VTDGVYVHGVARARAPDLGGLHGIDGAEVRRVEHAGLVALTSRLGTSELGARDIRAHWRVLERAFERTTVLPIRFGTVLESEAAVRERLLAPSAARLTELLDAMAELVQLNLTARYDEERLLTEIVRSSRPIARLRERAGSVAEQIRLGQIVEEEVAQRRELHMRLALDALAPVALDVRDEQAAHPTAFKLSFLVERDRERAFSEAVGRLGAQLGELVELRYVGPLPPFSFAEENLSARTAAWA
jgi:hypothetical protein